MELLLNAEDDLSLKLDANVKRNLEYYLIVKKRKNLSGSYYKESYYSYNLNPTEIDILLKNMKYENITSFCETYQVKPTEEGEEIIVISLYEGFDVHTSIGKPLLVYVFEAGKPGYVQEIIDTREALKEIVEGEIEYVYVGRDDLVLICNETGMLDNLPKHRGIHGTFLIRGVSNGFPASLTEKQIKEIRDEFDKKENYKSKSSYLKNYFDTHSIPRKVFNYTIDSTVLYIGTEIIIEFILQQENERALEMIELQIKNIEKNNEDIYEYLESIGRDLAKQRVL